MANPVLSPQHALVIRVSFSNLFKEFRSTATWLQFPLVCSGRQPGEGGGDSGQGRGAGAGHSMLQLGCLAVLAIADHRLL